MQLEAISMHSDPCERREGHLRAIRGNQRQSEATRSNQTNLRAQRSAEHRHVPAEDGDGHCLGEQPAHERDQSP
jgi:hypothetical protein